MSMHSTTSIRFAALLTALGLVATVGVTRDVSAARGSVSTVPVYNLWDLGTVVGTSRLVRTSDGVTATLTSSDLPPGHAVTMWIAVFNNPAACATSPCTWDDGANPAVQLDFLWGAGTVVGQSGKGTLAGRLKVGDPSGSANIEFGGTGIGLLDAWNAEVYLLLHSHGPAGTGQLLKSQMTSFLGGCQSFLPGPGPDRFASGPQDIPASPGQCSTFQGSAAHQ